MQLHRILFLIDTSASMSGAPMEAARQSVGLLGSALSDAAERLHTPIEVSVTVFDLELTEVVANVEPSKLTLPSLSAGGLSSVGRALTYARQQLGSNSSASSVSKSLVFLFTDGDGTDLETPFSKKWQLPSVIIALACGLHPNTRLLHKLTPYVFDSAQLTTDRVRDILDQHLN